jgi:hypothetical protein
MAKSRRGLAARADANPQSRELPACTAVAAAKMDLGGEDGPGTYRRFIDKGNPMKPPLRFDAQKRVTAQPKAKASAKAKATGASASSGTAH